MTSGIRNIAVGMLVRDGHVLAEEYPSVADAHRYLRAIGGGIEFGERAADAVRREFREELGVELTDVVALAVTENLFEIDGRACHEIAHVFAVRCPVLENLPLDARRAVLDAGTTVGWFALDDLRSGDLPFYPVGMFDLSVRAGQVGTGTHGDER